MSMRAFFKTVDEPKSGAIWLNLDSAVVATHLTQAIDSPGISEESLITNKVTAISPDTPDKPISYAMHAPPTAESRLNYFFTRP
ncbi:MAG: hypothetical protein HQL68_04110 [Magnetococcales bacterium]|nr:hypothetical protein [Magnetococcales bacterium]